MLNKDQGVFLQVPGSPSFNALHPAVVRDSAQHSVTVQCDNDFACSPGEQVILYFERQRKFMRALMRVEAQLKRDPNPILILEQRSRAENADRREHPRFCTRGDEILATFGVEQRCPVSEVSQSGLSLSATSHYYLGSMVQTVISFADQRFEGRACVQSVREMEGDMSRYGLHCAQDPESEPLRAGLRFICQTIERRHLAALRGTG